MAKTGKNSDHSDKDAGVKNEFKGTLSPVGFADFMQVQSRSDGTHLLIFGSNMPGCVIETAKFIVMDVALRNMSEVLSKHLSSIDKNKSA